MIPRKIKPVVLLCSIGAVLLFGGCRDSAQQQAFEDVAKMEQQLSHENSAILIAQYQRVVRMEPGSAWARKAQARIDALEAQIKADELHQSVFQEHGVD